MENALPFQDTIAQGLKDLAHAQGRETVPALLVSIGAPKLRQLGFAVPPALSNPEGRLYARLSRERPPDSAHSAYNALLRRLVSFERAAACVIQPPSPG